MIKIQEHLELQTGDVDSYLSSLVNEHWSNLNPKLAKNKGYKKTAIKEKLNEYLKLTDTKNYIEKFANNDVETAKRHKLFFNYLIDDEFKKLKKIIISKPSEFNTIKNDIFKIIPEKDFYVGTLGNYNQTAFGKLLTDKIFDYKNFRNSPFCKELFIKLGYKSATCPYCNYIKLDIVTITRNSSKATLKKAYLDLDHFYAKALNPFFALSFYNLIPSCHNCNSSDKGDKPFSIETEINPYHESFNDLYEFTIPNLSLLNNTIKEIQILKKPFKRIDNSIDAFNLLSKYNNNFSFIEKLVNHFINNVNRYKGTENEIYFRESILLNIPLNKNQILNYEKGKQNRDILKQLDVNNILGIM